MRKYLFLAVCCLVIQTVCRSDKAQLVQDKKKQGDLVRQRDLFIFRNHFRQLGLAYAAIVAAEGKGPAKKEDLAAQLQNAKKIVDMLDKGDIVFYYGVRPDQMPNGPSNTVLAHESYHDKRGRRLVLMGDGSVREMTSADFAKAPKAKK